MLPDSSNRMSNLLIAGVVLTVLGFFIFGFGFVFGSLQAAQFGSGYGFVVPGLGGLMFLTGVGIIMATLAKGLSVARNGQRSGNVVRIDNARIAARFAVNRELEMLFSEEDIFFDDPSYKLYVKIQTPEGRVFECRCNEAVWRNAGEGTKGTALVQGDWLGQFMPSIGTGQGRPYEEVAESRNLIL
jgi:hypothetical protein